ncbi:MAG: hypothetical protein ACHQ0J_15930 [Candidatus Dormibacterales bacterium]
MIGRRLSPAERTVGMAKYTSAWVMRALLGQKGGRAAEVIRQVAQVTGTHDANALASLIDAYVGDAGTEAVNDPDYWKAFKRQAVERLGVSGPQRG